MTVFCGDNVLAYRYLFLGGLFCFVVHPVCRLKVINKSCAKTRSHVFYLKTKISKTTRWFTTSGET